MNKARLSAIVVAVAVSSASSHARMANQQPEAGSSAGMAPMILKRQLSNGLRVWIVEQHDLPVTQMSLLVMAGTDADPPGQYGIASLTSAMLTEGAGSRTAVEIADALDAQRANLSGSCGVDSCSLQMYVPVAALADALPLMADVAERPTFSTDALETLRQQRRVALRNARGDPDAIAALAFARGVYGPSHRSAAAAIGTDGSLSALTPEALRAFHQSTYRPDNSTLIVVGDVMPDGILSLLETHFGKWPPAVPADPVHQPAAAPPNASRQLTVVDMPGSPQSRILIGGAGAPTSMADFFPIQIVNTILQGRLSSDRNVVLRDYTTGVRSGFDMRKSGTPFVVAAAAQADKTAESLKALVDELAAVAKGIPPDEFARAKDDIALKFPKTFEATGRISSRLRALESLLVYGLPDDHYANYVTATQKVQLADVQRVVQQYVRPDQLTIAIVGDRKTIEPSIRALNLASIKVASVDDLFGPVK